MKTSVAIAVVVALLIGIGAWYFSMGQNYTATPDTTAGVNDESAGQTDTGQENIPAVLNKATDPKLGTYLTALDGMTLYLYTKDVSGVSNCTGQCLVNWPPYTVSPLEPLVAGEGITGEIGLINRGEGMAQLTYKGIPLYFWKDDKKVGDTTGQNVGGVWFVVHP